MKILAVIPARGGSKRLPRKNIRNLGGLPLIGWTIESCKNITEICGLLVSTDDEIIGNSARDMGCMFPWLRPKELSTDSASSIDVVLHSLDWYETNYGKVDGVMMLQPTSPFRKKETIKSGIELFRTRAMRPVLGVSPVRDHPYWVFKKHKDHLKPFVRDGGLEIRSQDLPEAYIANGCLYIITPTDLRGNHSFITNDTSPLIIDSMIESLDIDTDWDWRVASMIVESKIYEG